MIYVMINKVLITQFPNSFIVSQTRDILLTNDVMHVLILDTSSSLHSNSMSRYVILSCPCLTIMFLVIEVFLFLVSEKAGST